MLCNCCTTHVLLQHGHFNSAMFAAILHCFHIRQQIHSKYSSPTYMNGHSGRAVTACNSPSRPRDPTLQPTPFPKTQPICCREVLAMWRQQGDTLQSPLTPHHQHSWAAQAPTADLSPPSALPRQASSPQQEPPPAPQAQADTPPWQANPVAQTQAAAASQLPSDLERPNLLSSSSHVQVPQLSTLPYPTLPPLMLSLSCCLICPGEWFLENMLAATMIFLHQCYRL